MTPPSPLQEIIQIFQCGKHALAHDERRKLVTTWESHLRDDNTRKELLKKSVHKGLVHVLVGGG